MMFDLRGKTAIVTGSTKGIGKAIAEAFAQQGANVVVSSRKADAVAEVTKHVNENFAAHGGKAIGIPCNISYKEQLEMLVAETRSAFGKVDILVCNAAVNPFYGSSLDIPDSAFDKIMDVNIKSNHWAINLVLPEMIERKDGVIIIVSSIGGLRGSRVLGAYAISKAADMQMVRNIAMEYGKSNIRANAIAPGLIQTDFARALWEDPEFRSRSEAQAPLNRIGQPEEIAGLAVYMAASEGSFLTGQTIAVDGGVTISGG
ncbi:MAG: SDR family oxidoreductase [Pseudomonadota bacterium]|nr:SDR family oxidoreductase [Pseudomonadota bacterium]